MSNYFLPSPYIERIIVSNDKSETVKAELLINLKSHYSEAISEEDAAKFQITMLVVRDVRVSQMLDTSVEMVRFVIDNYQKTDSPSVPLIYQRMAVRKELIPYHHTPVFYEMIREKCSITQITNFDLIHRNENNYLTHLEREIDVSSGHLSFYLFVDFDKNNTPTNNQQNDTFLVGETVLDEGEIASFSYGYYTINDDQIWNGEVQDLPEGLFTDETPRRELARRRFYNTKIQDFRVFKKQETRANSLVIPEIKKYQDLQIIDSKNYLKTSDNAIQHISTNAVGINVVVSLPTILRKYSAAYNILQNMEQSEIRNFSLSEIKVYRKRVREELKQSSKLTRIARAEMRDQEREDFVENERKFYLPNTDFVVTRNRPDIVVININDRDYVNNITTGDYCYGVEVYFRDPIVSLLKTLLEQFENTRSEIEKYYKDSTILGYYDSAGNYTEGHYDPEINKFTDKFITKWKSQQDFYKTVINDYASILKKISKNTINNDIGTINYLLLTQIAPQNGTPDNILAFLNMYETNLALLRKVYETTRNNTINKEEKYFNKFVHVVSKRQYQSSLQQLPFSMKLVTVNGLSIPFGENQQQESLPGIITETEKHPGYAKIRNILENSLGLEINEDFSEIKRVRSRPDADEVVSLSSVSTNVLVDRNKIANLSSEEAENIVAGILGAPKRTTTKNTSNNTIADVYKEQQKKKQRGRSK